jgi:hypothetical protein
MSVAATSISIKEKKERRKREREKRKRGWQGEKNTPGDQQKRPKIVP